MNNRYLGETKKMIQIDYVSGMTIRDVSLKYNVPKSSVYYLAGRQPRNKVLGEEAERKFLSIQEKERINLLRIKKIKELMNSIEINDMLKFEYKLVREHSTQIEIGKVIQVKKGISFTVQDCNRDYLRATTCFGELLDKSIIISEVKM